MKNKRFFQLLAFSLILFQTAITAQVSNEKVFQIRGLCIGAPKPADVDRFVKFISVELVPRKINTLVLLVDWNYQFESYPQLRDSGALSKADVKKMVAVCKKNNIRIIPQINMLGHQSWASKPGKLLEKFPEFDETPWVKYPDKFVWPNPDGYYCKSYCPLHPDVHKVVFAVIDELCDAYETNAFHAGMDEVFYLGEEKCPRCSGIDKAVLFADEVNRIKAHLDTKNRELWMWGDRFIDGKTTGIGEWEASFNYTNRAVDMVPKDIVICDWHYERPDQTPVYFAMKGFRVLTCPWRTPQTAVVQAEDMAKFVKYATPEMKPRYYGMLQTTWMDPAGFMDGFYGKLSDEAKGAVHPDNASFTPWDTFKAMFKRMDEIEKVK